jgi:hypothetical protein
MNKIVSKIENIFIAYFSESIVKLHPRKYGLYTISGFPLSKAINIIRNDREPINVLKWFDDFWMYFEIRFIQTDVTEKKEKPSTDIENQEHLIQQEHLVQIDNKYYQINLSMSIFQGVDSDSIKTQLFRAEWDNYLDNRIHPQPHWHIYPFKYDYKTYKDFETFLEIKDEPGFEEFIEAKTKHEIIDISNLHFAMNGQWSTNNGHTHFIKNIEILFNWLNGLLDHIKEQLEYVK